MPDLSINFAGIKSPNPFWLASAPPTNSGYQVMKAFDAGWGGAVWKTLGVPVVNVSSRYGGVNYREAQLMMEMIADTGRMGSLDLVEVNPALDKRNATALLAVELVESLFGKSTLMRD